MATISRCVEENRRIDDCHPTLQEFTIALVLLAESAVLSFRGC